MKQFVRMIALLLCVSMLSLTAYAAQEGSLDVQLQATAKALSAFGGKEGQSLKDQNRLPAGTSACDWTAVVLALSGSQEFYEEYLGSLQDYVEQRYAGKGCLEEVKSTEYHRIALTVLALGGDPTAFGKKPDGSSIDLIAEGTYNFAGESVGLQGLNGWIYALITLDASGVEVPGDARFQRQDMLDAIVGAQEPDGGFGLIPGHSDVDITAMALQALAAYRSQYGPVIENGLNYLAQQMTVNCGFGSGGEESAESTAQVIMALCSLGIDPEKDARFHRGASTLLTNLDQFRREDGTYSHLKNDRTGNALATAQTMQAMIALQRLRAGGNGLFDFRGYQGPNQKKAVPAVIYIVAGVAVAGAAVMLAAGKRRKNGKNN